MTTDNKFPMISLKELPRGCAGEIIALKLTGSIKRRLLDLGLVPGTKIKVAFPSPLGDPKAYYIRGTTLAFRANEALSIMVRRLDP